VELLRRRLEVDRVLQSDPECCGPEMIDIALAAAEEYHELRCEHWIV
jgi:hypothetical protein